MKNLIIAVQLCIIVFMGYRLAHIENQRYALYLGMCDRDYGVVIIPDFKCLDNVETRIHWVWNLWFSFSDY